MSFNWLGSFCIPISVVTIDNAVNTLISLSVPENKQIAINAMVNGMNNPSADAITAFIRFAAFRSVGQNIILMGSPIIEIFKNRNNLHANINCSVDTNNQLALITVQGIASQTWNWMASYTYLFCNV